MKKLLSGIALLALSASCQTSGGTVVSGSGATGEPATPYGLPRETPIGGERPHPTVTSPPSNIPPTPRR
ncbi:MAG: hypothetical protein LC796_06670 [Acidobacteria bacterium]|nr:hypothetical protein [Acidobacteriota bacterium]MCA1610609.1 hypothetical protein [Acidobacteriota bacterium]